LAKLKQQQKGKKRKRGFLDRTQGRKEKSDLGQTKRGSGIPINKGKF
jgi:hypothetical protein